MDDDLDVEAMLDESYIRQEERTSSASPEIDRKKKSKKKKHSHSREREYPHKEDYSHKEYPHKEEYSHKEYPHKEEYSHKEYPHKEEYSNKEEFSHREDYSHKEYRNDRPSKREYSRSPDRRDSSVRYRERRSFPEFHPRERRRYSRSPDRRRGGPRGYYRGGFGRGSFGGNRDYRRHYPRSRSRSRERRQPSRPKIRSPSPRRESKNSEEFDKPARLHRNPDLSPEERDMRTVFCMQLSQRVRARDLEEFFSPVGKVQDVRIIMDNKTRRSKGIAYVEFQETFSVSLAMGYSGKKLLGVPIIVQLTQAEKNRAAASLLSAQRGNVGPMRLYVGSLHFNITEEMLKGIFEPFGKIDRIELLKDTETGRSKGYGFVTFHDSESAKKALDQLNGFELAGRPMKVGTVTDRTDLVQGPSFLDTEEMDRAGIDLGATGRLQLMAKLAEGTGFELPEAAVKALELTSQVANSPMPTNNAPVSVATQCFILANMFDPTKENGPTWDEDIRNDVIDECRNHGGALHVYVDKNSLEGNVYVKCPNLTVAGASVTALHGRYFAGRVILASYVPVLNYNMLFPESATLLTVL